MTDQAPMNPGAEHRIAATLLARRQLFDRVADRYQRDTGRELYLDGFTLDAAVIALEAEYASRDDAGLELNRYQIAGVIAAALEEAEKEYGDQLAANVIAARKAEH